MCKIIKDLFEAIKLGVPVQSFDDDVVRLSLRLADGSFIFADQNGEVIYGEKIVRLPEDYIASLDKKLYKLQQRIFAR